VKTYLDCWIEAASALLPQALAGGPEFVETALCSTGEEAFGFAATIAGADRGRFILVLDGALASAPLLGDGVDQKAAWGALVRETLESAAARLQAATGKICRVEKVEAIEDHSGAEGSISPRAFALKSGERSWTILVHDELRQASMLADGAKARPGETPDWEDSAATDAPRPDAGLAPGLELLLDVELEASLRFGSREMLLGKILDLGPGDVVQLDRQVTDPVDLIVGDKIVARGEVVLVNGNFGIRVTEVAAPRKRLESIRCLF
jgi:flagellar motor switch protein FliN